ncbi:putative nuclease HARBI1 [Merluccius polli]|uniref:Nuclease HARBI1 n=1 Tax=Merluccius polli TaxID=89951 RepID=A0AA47MXY8_MERPO|nr:putative nuclease HARBI1 [Merluccius polli]
MELMQNESSQTIMRRVIFRVRTPALISVSADRRPRSSWGPFKLKEHGWGLTLETLVFLFWIATGSAYRVVTRVFGIPISSVHRMVHNIAEEVVAVRYKFSLKTRRSSRPWEKGLHGWQGTLPSTKIKCPSGPDGQDYVNRKLYPSMVLQAVCDHQGRFIDAYMGFPGSVHDARILRNSAMVVIHVLQSPWRLSHHKWPLRGMAEQRFNTHHSRGRSIVERAFGMMKTRFRCIFLEALEVHSEFVPKYCTTFVGVGDKLPVEDVAMEGDDPPPPERECGAESRSGAPWRMGEERGLLKRLKPKLIDILSADPELVLQECHALDLVTDAGYKMVRPQQVSTEKVTALLDHVYDRGPEAAHGLMELLRGDVFLENFPRLSFLKAPDVDQPRPSTGRGCIYIRAVITCMLSRVCIAVESGVCMLLEETLKGAAGDSAEEAGCTKRRRKSVPELVTEKQLMEVAGAITGNWKEVGILVLDVRSEKLDAIKEDNPTSTMQAFRMLHFWRCCQKAQATAAKLYSLLSIEKLAIAPESLAVIFRVRTPALISVSADRRPRSSWGPFKLKEHGWGLTLETLVFLFWIATGSAYRVVTRVFGIPISSVHRMVHNIAEEVVAVRYKFSLKTRRSSRPWEKGLHGWQGTLPSTK